MFSWFVSTNIGTGTYRYGKQVKTFLIVNVAQLQREKLFFPYAHEEAREWWQLLEIARRVELNIRPD